MSAPSTATATSFLPLTTVFTPSPQCYSSFYSGLYAFDASHTLAVGTCVPREAVASSDQSGGTTTVLSPFVCPQDFTTVRTESQYTYCCPRGYQVNYFTDATTTSSTRTSCVSTVASGNGVVDYRGTIVSTTTASEDVFIFADALTGYNAATSSVPASTTAPSAVAASTSSVSSETASASPAVSQGLSTGAQAGIGVGVAAGALIILAFAALLLLKRRRSVKEISQELAADEKAYPSEVHAESKVSELGGKEEVVEMPDSSVPSELASSTR